MLVNQGIDVSGISAYGESGLRVLSRLGRFDAVRLLLNAGADRSQLEWTALMEAVALGSIADVQAVLVKETALEERDWWSRTAWLIALLTGDIAKAKLLGERGADTAAVGRCGCPPLFYAILGNHLEMLRWLLKQGADVNQSDDFGSTALIEAVENDDPEMVRWLLKEPADIHQSGEFGRTALIEAVENDDLEIVEILLDAGADVEANSNGTALSRATSREIIMRLLDAGADPADANHRVILGLQAPEEEALGAVTPARVSLRGYSQVWPDESRADKPPVLGRHDPLRCLGLRGASVVRGTMWPRH